jgi:hypothetical protein
MTDTEHKIFKKDDHTQTRYFLSYKFTGINVSELHEQIDPIVSTIKSHNNDVFCNLYYNDHYLENQFSAKQIMDHCFNEMKSCNAYIAYVSDIFSGGMAIECGYAYSLGLKIIACLPINQESFASLEGISSYVIRYDDIRDLCRSLDYIIDIMCVKSVTQSSLKVTHKYSPSIEYLIDQINSFELKKINVLSIDARKGYFDMMVLKEINKEIHYTAIDPSSVLLEELRRNLCFVNELNVVISLFDDEYVDPNKYDIIIMSHCPSPMTDDAIKKMLHAKTLLSKGGKIYAFHRTSVRP